MLAPRGAAAGDPLQGLQRSTLHHKNILVWGGGHSSGNYYGNYPADYYFAGQYVVSSGLSSMTVCIGLVSVSYTPDKILL
jgi:hypothetical protein